MLISRRRFLSYALKAGLMLGLSSSELFKVEIWARGSGPGIVWLEGAGCSGCLVSLANYYNEAGSQTISDLLVDVDLRYAPLLMSASGESAMVRLVEIMNLDQKEIILLVAGAIPTQSGFCSVGSFDGKQYDFKETVVELAMKAVAVVGIGSCAAYGGVASTRDSEPRFAPLEHFLPATTPPILIPGCPPHPDWITAVLLDLIAGRNVDVDRFKRPLSFFGQTVCSQCSRLPQKRAGKFAQTINSTDLCLKMVGCRGEESRCDSPTRGWNESDTWCLAVNSICIGCTEPFFPNVPFVEVQQESSDGHDPMVEQSDE